MSARIAISVVGAAMALGAQGVAAASEPSPSQISAAIRAAEHSDQLWATVNVCTTNHHGGRVGIRGQMPSLGFPTDMYMTFEATYRTSARKRFKPLPTTKTRVLVGHASNRVLQGGRTYPFKTPSVLVAGRVTFEWRRGGTLLGRTTRKTTGGHHPVDFAEPRGYSQATCKLH